MNLKQLRCSCGAPIIVLTSDRNDFGTRMIKFKCPNGCCEGQADSNAESALISIERSITNKVFEWASMR